MIYSLEIQRSFPYISHEYRVLVNFEISLNFLINFNKMHNVKKDNLPRPVDDT